MAWTLLAVAAVAFAGLRTALAVAARCEAQRGRPAGNAQCPNCARLEDELRFALDDLEAERARATALGAAAPPNTEQGRG